MVENPTQYDFPKWTEKIGDSINYLALLYAVVFEEITEVKNEAK